MQFLTLLINSLSVSEVGDSAQAWPLSYWLIGIIAVEVIQARNSQLIERKASSKVQL